MNEPTPPTHGSTQFMSRRRAISLDLLRRQRRLRIAFAEHCVPYAKHCVFSSSRPSPVPPIESSAV